MEKVPWGAVGSFSFRSNQTPGNTEAEIHEKMALYFDAGAQEVWLCAAAGAMSFFGPGGAQPLSASQIRQRVFLLPLPAVSVKD